MLSDLCRAGDDADTGISIFRPYSGYRSMRLGIRIGEPIEEGNGRTSFWDLLYQYQHSSLNSVYRHDFHDAGQVL